MRVRSVYDNSYIFSGKQYIIQVYTEEIVDVELNLESCDLLKQTQRIRTGLILTSRLYNTV